MGRYLKAIPPHIVQLLQNKFGKKFTEIKGRELRKIFDQIDKKIRLKKEEKASYKQHFKRGAAISIELFSLRSFSRYLKGYPIHTNRLNALLFFLDVEPYEFEQKIEDARSISEQAYVNLLQGPWTSYYYNPHEGISGSIMQAEFFLGAHTESSLHVHATDPPWSEFGGRAAVLGNNLVFDMHSYNRRIYVCCELPEDKKPEEYWILNGGYLATGSAGKVIMTNIILVKNDHTRIPNEKGQKKKRKQPTDEEIALQEGHEAICTYLLRKNKHPLIRPFSPNTFPEVKIRNNQYEKELGRENFDRLRSRLKSAKGFCYYSFNRHRTRREEVAVFSYTFEFWNAEKIVWAARHRIGEPDKIEFAGEVVLEAEKIYMTLRDRENKRRKQLIADFALDSDSPNVIKAITSTVSTINAKILGLRELITHLPEKVLELDEDERATGYISYKRFLNLPDEVLRPEDRLYLADRTQCTLSYPNTTDLKLVYVRQNKARNFAGTYNLIVRNFEEQRKQTFLRIIVVIDELAQASLLVRYEEDGKSYRYEGTSEFFNHNLKIDVQYPATHTSEQRNLIMFFDQIQEGRKLPAIYSGMFLGTDEKNRTVASRFVALTEAGMRSINKSGADPDVKRAIANGKDPGIIELKLFKKLWASLPPLSIQFPLSFLS